MKCKRESACSLVNFNSLYWDFCSASKSVKNWKLKREIWYFNSLYWDFCSASAISRDEPYLKHWQFQFPLLGFLLCIIHLRSEGQKPQAQFQFPLLGFLLCIVKYSLIYSCKDGSISIPFIGIFALHRLWNFQTMFFPPSYFNSLYWDFCSASWTLVNGGVKNVDNFNSLYWDFCSASSKPWKTVKNRKQNFNSLYWDFCSASICGSFCAGCNKIQFQFPLLGFLLCIGMVMRYPSITLVLNFNSLYWDFCSASLVD